MDEKRYFVDWMQQLTTCQLGGSPALARLQMVVIYPDRGDFNGPVLPV